MAKEQMSADEAATAAAEAMLGKSGGSGGMPTSQMGSEGGLSEKAPGKPIVKSDEDKGKDKDKVEGDQEGDGEGEGDELDKKCGDAKKSEGDTVEADALMKSLDVLEATAEGVGEGETDRRAELAAKVADGTINKSEQSELVELLGGEQGEGDQGEGDFNKSFSEMFATDDQMAKDYEVAPFIERHSQMVAEALDGMRDSMSKSAGEQQVFNRALAKSFRGIGQVVTQQGDLIKSLHDQNQALTERLGVVESTPNARKGMTGAQPLNKSFAGSEGAIGLSEAQITEGLNKLMVKSRNNNFLAPCGEPLDVAINRYETERTITKSMLGDVAQEVGVQLPPMQ